MIRAGTAPKWIESPQGFSEGSHRVVPVAPQSRDLRPRSQAPSRAIRGGRRALRRAGQRGRIGRGWRRRRTAAAAASGPLSTSWSASSSEANRNCRASLSVPESGQRLAALAVDQPCGGTQILLFAFAAGDLVGAPGDRQVDHGGHQAAASRISSSSSSTTSRTLARSSSSRADAGRPARQRALDPLERPFGAVQCRQKARDRPSRHRYASWQSRASFRGAI